MEAQESEVKDPRYFSQSIADLRVGVECSDVQTVACLFFEEHHTQHWANVMTVSQWGVVEKGQRLWHFPSLKGGDKLFARDPVSLEQ